MESASAIDLKLFNSSHIGDVEGVLDALAQGGRVAMRTAQGGTPLLAAAQEGHSDICGLLLAYGGDVNEIHIGSNSTALHLAAAMGHNAVAEVLLSWGAIADPQNHVGLTPLFMACQEGHMAFVLTLLKAGASVTLQNSAMPIIAAAARNRVEILRTLIDFGCSPNSVSCRKYM